MVSIKADVRDVAKLADSIESMTMRLDAAAEKIATQAGLIVQRYARKEFRGETSAPPTPPRPTQRTGNLRNSITVSDQKRVSFGTWSAKVGPTMIYGRRVELGYKGTGKGRGQQTTRAFPYLSPGFDKSRNDVIDMYQSEWRKALKG